MEITYVPPNYVVDIQSFPPWWDEVDELIISEIRQLIYVPEVWSLGAVKGKISRIAIIGQANDLSFLPYSLKKLVIDKQENVNLYTIPKLPYLKSLTVSECKVKELGWMANQTIEELYLQENELTDISLLNGLNLKKLNLRLNRIIDLSPIRNMNLTFLSVSANRIRKIDFLIKSLVELDLSSNQITDISFLNQLHSLELCNLSYNPIVNFTINLDTWNVKKLDLIGTNVNIHFIGEAIIKRDRYHILINKIYEIILIFHFPNLWFPSFVANVE